MKRIPTRGRCVPSKIVCGRHTRGGGTERARFMQQFPAALFELDQIDGQATRDAPWPTGGSMPALKSEPPRPVSSIEELVAIAHAMEHEAATRYAELALRMREEGNAQ